MSGLAARLTRREALAFRTARHHLAERLGPAQTHRAGVVGLQDTPPGTAALALAARADVGPDALDEFVLVPSTARLTEEQARRLADSSAGGSAL